MVVYYVGLCATLWTRGLARVACLIVAGVATMGVVSGQPAGWLQSRRGSESLRVTAFDVGQGDATLIEFPNRATLLVDAGGLPFGSGSFDVGSRVLSPALWARGLRSLDALLFTHGDPDHIGGASAIVDDFAPSEVWEGIPVAQHAGLRAVLKQARGAHAYVRRRLAGDEFAVGRARIRVLHPSSPDWEPQAGRHDDLTHGGAAHRIHQLI